MKRKLIGVMIVMYCIGIASACGSETLTIETPETEIPGTEETGKQKDPGSLTPEKALEYMKTTENLLIVDVASITNYDRIHFEEAINIPIENIDAQEEQEQYRKLPGGRPVILHCRQGVIVPGAYRRLKDLRPDIPEISYIAGVPFFNEYNQWYEAQNKQ